MSENFLKFKRKSRLVTTVKALLYGTAAGLFSSGLFLILSKLCVINIDPVISLAVGAVALLAFGLVLYFILRKSDIALARELDRDFGLDERVETMLAFGGECGAMLDMQREDTEKTLGDVKLKEFKARRLWICFIALGVGLVMTVVGLIVPNLRDYTPPEKIIPFEFTEMQKEGINELIRYVESSDMEEPYRKEISDELKRLIGVLEVTKTQRDMQAALAESMAYILASTVNSSSMTEIANALWNTEDDYAKMLARVINTGDWGTDLTKIDIKYWGEYAEKYAEFKALYAHKQIEDVPASDEASLISELKWKLQNSAMKIESALPASKIANTDMLYIWVSNLINIDLSDEDGTVYYGFKILPEKMAEMTYAEAEAALALTFDKMARPIFDVINQQKINTNVGEYTMTKLSTLFLVPLPGFERPDFVKNGGDASDSDKDEDEDKSEGESSGGGIGAGATYGSDDYVLDPSTGEYVKYGTLLSKYYAVMTAKLESGNYTDAQKEAIIKYFDLLYGGIKKDEGK